MSLNDEIFSRVRSQGPEACLRFIDAQPPGRNGDDRRTLASWRARLLSQSGRYSEALDALSSAQADFNSKSGFAWRKAELQAKLGLVDQAISTLKEAPIVSEISAFPGLAWEAAYYCCHLTKLRGEAPPRDLLNAIPQDFETMIDGRALDKNNLLDRKL